jgi:hypothetical protein
MKYYSLQATNNLYTCIGQSTIHKCRVFHAGFREFCKAIAKLEHDLGELAQDDAWKKFLQPIKYHLFTLYAAPVPVSWQSDDLISSSRSLARRCQLHFPDFVSHVQLILDKALALAAAQDNPLVEAISQQALSNDDHHKVALLLKETWLFPLADAILDNCPGLRHVELVNQYQLRGPYCYDQLFVIGPSRWYQEHEYILRSPRARQVYVVRYGWLPDRWRAEPLFLSAVTYQQPATTTKNLVEDDDPASQDSLDGISTDKDLDILPEINWMQISTRMMRQVQEDHSQEDLPARLYLLAAGYAVFLDATENAKVLVLDLEDEVEDEDNKPQQVKYLTISKLRPGMFLLLRTEGGGDYIIPIADRILRENAVSLRARQEEWKSRLRKEVEAKGAFATSIELLDYGAERANEVNVRNWMSSRNIRPQDDRDFDAILKLAGLQGREQEYRNAARQIETARRQAGFYIRQQLLNQVARANLSEIHRKGYMDFELPEADGGSMTAFRIEHIAPEFSTVPASRIGRPVKVRVS